MLGVRANMRKSMKQRKRERHMGQMETETHKQRDATLDRKTNRLDSEQKRERKKWGGGIEQASIRDYQLNIESLQLLRFFL